MCSCASHPQKTWLRQHRKWLSVDRRGSKVGPRCREPEALAGRHLLTVKDSELCPLPSVVSLDYASRDPYDFLVTWESPDTNMTGLKGFIVAYHRLDRNDQVRKYRVGPTIRGFRIHAATDNALYLVCVVTRGSSFGPSSGEEEMAYDEGDPNRRNKYDKEDFQEEDDYSEDDNQFYVMPLEWTREERSADASDYELESVIGAGGDDDEEEDSGGFDFNSLLGPFGMGSDQFTNIINGTAFDFDEFPSSNDTDLLVVRPTVVNLGSRSSKCIQIRTPPDPAKLSLIDNKRISVVIGVGMGLLVFVCIIISIVAVKSDGDDEEPVVVDNEGGENSLSSSHKSPKMSSSNAPAPIIRPSRANSISSSMAAKLLESEGNSATAVERIKKHEKEKESKKAESLAGTLKRKAMSSRQQSAEKMTDRSGRGKKGNSSASRGQQWSHLRRRGEGSTTDSRRSSSESTTTCTRGHSRHNSFDGGISGDYVNVGRSHPYRSHHGNGGQSWHGTPRVDPLGRRSMYEVSGGAFGGSRGFLEQHQYSSTTFPRRHTAAFGEVQQQQLLQHQPLHHRLLGTSRSLDAAEALKRRSDPSLQHQDENASMPLIEYHLVDATNDPPSIAGRGHFPPALPASSNVPLSGFYPSTARGWNGARPKALSNTPPVLRSTTFGISDASNHAPPLPPPNRPPPPAPPPQPPTVGNHISAGTTLSAALNGNGVGLQHDPSAAATSAANPSVDDLELEGIDYFPEDAPLTGRTTTATGGTLPTSRVGSNGGAGGGRSFIKYNSFANY